MNNQDEALLLGTFGKDIVEDPDDITASSVSIDEWRGIVITPGGSITTLTLSGGEVCNGIDGKTFVAGITLPVRFTAITGTGLFILIR